MRMLQLQSQLFKSQDLIKQKWPRDISLINVFKLLFCNSLYCKTVARFFFFIFFYCDFPQYYMSYLVLLLMPQTNLQNLLQSLAPMFKKSVQLPSPVLQHFKEIANFQAAAVGSLNQLWICIWPFTFEFFYEFSQLLAFV